MPRYVFVLRHSSFADLQDDAAAMELPDDAAAREFAAKVMSGLVWQKEDNWAGWTMEVWQGGRRVWHLPFDPKSRPIIIKVKRDSAGLSAETKTQRQKPANCGLLGRLREISRLERMRGGPERTRTACHARSHTNPSLRHRKLLGS